jgi:hypothetical protein
VEQVRRQRHVRGERDAILSTVTVMKYLISFTLVVTMRQQGLGPAQGGVSKGDTRDAAGKII